VGTNVRVKGYGLVDSFESSHTQRRESNLLALDSGFESLIDDATLSGTWVASVD
jgi:hypothetical protein